MNYFRRVLACILPGLLLASLAPAAKHNQSASGQSLKDLVQKPYVDLLVAAPTVSFSAKEIESFRKQLDRDEEHERALLKQQQTELKRQIDRDRERLDQMNRVASKDSEPMISERRELHCRILKLERRLHQKNLERQQGVPVAYDNKMAKLDLLVQWPAKKKEIDQKLASGVARQRKFGNAEDIGVRKIAEGQEKDVKRGLEAIRNLKAYGLMPPEIEDKQLGEYIQRLTQNIALNSDLTVPVKVAVLRSDEINAFALPGGFLFINSGLIEKAENESELAGVISHELAHVAARHSAKMMKKATIASLIYSSAQIAAVIFTGGAVGIGLYYALQYGFFGLGMALNLALLGVNRDYEIEADQLGVQYAWKAGYDPRGFITFFDKMASEKGYVRSASFFRTHPPFFDRIVTSISEIEYLEKKYPVKVDSSEFKQTKARLKGLKVKLAEEDKNKPILKRMPECDNDDDLP